MSLVSDGFAAWRECRAAYEEVFYAQYVRAERATNGALVNPEGRARGVDPMSLFMGPKARAHRWASEELLDHWISHPRITFAEFERQWSRDDEAASA